MLHLDDPIAAETVGSSRRPTPTRRAVRVQFGHDGHAEGGRGTPTAPSPSPSRIGGRRSGCHRADRMQIMTPPSHILGLLNIATALDAGAWIRLHPRFDVDTMLRHIESDRITVEMAVAPIALAMAAHPELERFDLSSLRYVMWCATPVTPSVADERDPAGRRALGDRLRRQRVAGHLVQPARRRRGWTPSGGRCPASSCASCRWRRRAAADPGEDGEIQVRSDSVMAGYLPDDATAAAFSDGWYRTGDVGHLDADGWLRITDRSKEMIKVRGFQVAPAEVEAVLHGHPAVADCAVFGVPDAADGEAIVAAVARCGAVEADELIALVADRLASYKRPSRVVFVDRDSPSPFGKGVASSAEGAAMDVRLTAEQRQLREAAAKLADDLGPGSVADLDDEAASRDWRRRSRRPDGGRCAPTRRRASRWPSSPRSSPAGSSTCRSSARCSPTTSPAGSAARCPRCAEPDDRRSDGKPCGSGRVAGRARRALGARTPAAGTRWRSPRRRPTWSAPPAARWRWPPSTPRCASSTARRSGPTRRSGTCWRRAWR